MTADAIAAFRWVSLIVGIVGAVSWVMVWLKYPKKWGYIVAPISWLLFYLIFDITRILGVPIDALVLNLLSLGLHLYTATIVAGLGVIIWTDK
jgi:hypothetical protein